MSWERMFLDDDITWGHWRTRFAWLPTRTDDGLVWMRRYFIRAGHDGWARVQRQLTIRA